jgi:hypothetical protein
MNGDYQEIDSLPFRWKEKQYFFKNGTRIPCPGKRASGSPKKAVFPLNPMRTSAVFRLAIPFPPRLFEERE